MHPDTIKMFRWGDILIVLLLLSGVLYSIPLIGANKPDNVEVYRDNERIAEYPLYKDLDFPVQGITGTLKVRVKNNSVSIASSDCPHHLCMQIGTIGHSNQQIVCAPNHILITISNTKETNIPDGIAR